MCFNLILYNPNKIGKNGVIVLKNSINENINSNNDGFAIFARSGKKSLIKRTINKQEFIDFCKRSLSFFERSELIHLHLRASTNVLGEDFVHLWEFGGYLCSHNGILSGYSALKNKTCDSLEFFKKVEDALKNDNIQEISKSLSEENGYGVFLMTHKTLPKIIFASMGKSVKIHKNGDLIAISCEELPINTETSLLDLTLERMFFYFTEIENEIYLVDLNTMTFKKEKIATPHKIYTYWDYIRSGYNLAEGYRFGLE